MFHVGGVGTGRTLRSHWKTGIYRSVPLGKEKNCWQAGLLHLRCMNDLLVGRWVFSFRYFCVCHFVNYLGENNMFFLNVKLFLMCGFTANKCWMERTLLYEVSKGCISDSPDFLSMRRASQTENVHTGLFHTKLSFSRKIQGKEVMSKFRYIFCFDFYQCTW